jgi:hypothetical protein
MITNAQLPAVRIALDALRFFGLPAGDQVAIGRACRDRSDPVFFDAEARESNFFLGMACVFVTYKGALLNEIDCDRASDALEDFSHRLAVSMHNSSADEWTEVAVINGEGWQRLRRDASRAVHQLGVSEHSKTDLEFKIADLIDPDEFRTTDAAQAVLGAQRDVEP